MSTRTIEQVKKDLEKYLKRDNELLEHYGFSRSLIIMFPKNKQPLLGRLAIKLLVLTKARIDFRFTPTQK